MSKRFKKHCRNREGRRKVNRHHLRAKSKGGRNTPDNLLTIHVERHYYWHKLFHNKSLEEIIAILQRLAQMKHRLPA